MFAYVFEHNNIDTFCKNIVKMYLFYKAVQDKCVNKDNNVMLLRAPSGEIKSCQGSMISYRPDP